MNSVFMRDIAVLARNLTDGKCALHMSISDESIARIRALASLLEIDLPSKVWDVAPDSVASMAEAYDFSGTTGKCVIHDSFYLSFPDEGIKRLITYFRCMTGSAEELADGNAPMASDMGEFVSALGFMLRNLALKEDPKYFGFSPDSWKTFDSDKSGFIFECVSIETLFKVFASKARNKKVEIDSYSCAVPFSLLGIHSIMRDVLGVEHRLPAEVDNQLACLSTFQRMTAGSLHTDDWLRIEYTEDLDELEEMTDMEDYFHLPALLRIRAWEMVMDVRAPTDQEQADCRNILTMALRTPGAFLSQDV